MNRSEVAQLLTKIAAFDRRTIGEADVLAWHEVLSDVTLADALDGVRVHFRESTDWLMPATIMKHSRQLRRERLNRTPLPAPPPGLLDQDSRAYVEWVRETTEQIASGTYTESQEVLVAKPLPPLASVFPRVTP